MINHARVGVVGCFLHSLFVPIIACSAASAISIPKPQPMTIPNKILAYPIALKQCFEQFLATQEPANAGDPINPTMFRALIHGPTGTGKTFGAEQAAKDHGCEFRHIKTAQMLTKYQNSAANMLAEIFAQAARDSQSPNCRGIVLFFDEGNALGSRHSRDPNKDDSRAEEAMLLELDDWKRFNNKVLVIVATNKKDELSQPFLNRFSPSNDIEITNPDAEKIHAIIIDAYNTAHRPDLNLYIAETIFNNLSHLIETTNKSHLELLKQSLIEIDSSLRKFDTQHPDAALIARTLILIDKGTKLNDKLFFEHQNAIRQQSNEEEINQKANKLNKDLYVYIASYLTKYKKYLTEKRNPLPSAILDELAIGTSNMSIRSITVLLQEICLKANRQNKGEITSDTIREPLINAQKKSEADNKKTEAELAKQSEARVRELQIQQFERDQSKWPEQDRIRKVEEITKVLELGETIKRSYGDLYYVKQVGIFGNDSVSRHKPTIDEIKEMVEFFKNKAINNKNEYKPGPKEVALNFYEEVLTHL